MNNVPSGQVTFLFTDIEGSTKLSQDFPDTLQSALEKHHSIMQYAVESNDGFVFEIIGDAFCCAFQNANDAVKAAVDAQVNLSNEKWDDVKIKIRIGIHSGNAEWNGRGYMGYMTLARTARVMSVAYGEQIIITGNTYDLCRDKFDAIKEKDVTFLDLGERRLKDVIRPIRLFQIVCPGLREEFPALKTLDARPNNLPIQLTSFIGREAEMKEVRDLLSQTRLLTLTGPGGSGKTRLAMQVAADIIDDFESGVRIVELASLTEPELLPLSVSKELGLKEEQNKNPEDILCDYLKDKELLIILDNCEHLIDPCAKLAERLLSHNPKLKLIATSREALRCQGEQTHRVLSLGVPDPKAEISPEKLTQFEAVRLFIERALTVNSAFRVNNINAPALAQICYKLDGIPLAIELAAARTKVLPVEKINERLNDRFRLLTGGTRTSLPRQQTLRALIDWSYGLLTENEKILWSRLTVFSEGWTLEAAEAVCSVEKISGEEILDLLHQLTEKSIIIFESEKERYRILETLKQYGSEKLHEANDSANVSLKHFQYFLDFAEKASAKRNDINTQKWLDKVESDHSNLKSAIDWSVISGEKEQGAALACELKTFWDLRGYYSTGVKFVSKFLESREGLSKIALAKLAQCSAKLNLFIGEFETAQKLFEESLSLHRINGDKNGINDSLSGLGTINMYFGNYRDAQNYYRESLSISRSIGDKHRIANTLNDLGNADYIMGNFTEAQELYEESLELRRESGNQHGIDIVLFNLGNIAVDQGDISRARNLIEESLERSRETGNNRLIAASLNALGGIATMKGDFQTADKLIEESLILNREIGEKRGIARTLTNLGRLEMSRNNFEQAIKVFKECLELTQEIGEKSGIADALNSLGIVSYLLENFSLASKYFEESLSLRRELGEKRELAHTLNNMGAVLFSQGSSEEAQKFYKESLATRIEIGDRNDIPDCLIGIAGTMTDNHFSKGTMLLGAVSANMKSMDSGLDMFEQKLLKEINVMLHEKLSDEEYEKYFEEGRKLTLEQAVHLAVSS